MYAGDATVIVLDRIYAYLLLYMRLYKYMSIITPFIYELEYCWLVAEIVGFHVATYILHYYGT